MKTFLKPLKASEERMYLEELKNGSNDARQVLIERNLRLVAHIVKKYSQPELDAEDLISIGTIGLIKAVDSFNADKSSRISTYAAKCIDNEILMYLRAEKKRSRDVSLFESIGTDKEGNNITLVDVIECDEESAVDMVSLKSDIQNVYTAFDKALNEREKKVIALRYGLFGSQEFTQREIGSRLNISRSYVSRIEKSALEKLKNAMENM
ncbi:MAG: RNA polymerase sporulation sigma factor SigK [Lachnospiraceae bacterium]|nr:RNA polymerase sporulation sigma factor SigK [Lachnospiraceae bacterium]